MTFYEFAGNHPFLTFFLAGIVANVVIKVVFAITGYQPRKKKQDETSSSNKQA